MKVKHQSYKGTRDFYPETFRFQEYLFRQWIEVVELFGYERYDASIIEYFDLYAAKAQANDEIIQNQIYAFYDRGNRQVALRPEMTPSVARMIVNRQQELNYPLRWYSLPNVWRYERPQRGRLREHWQLNVDLFGLSEIDAELEIMAIIKKLMNNFGANDDMYQIHISSRSLLEDIFNVWFKVDTKVKDQLIHLLDRYHKLDSKTFQDACWQIFQPDAKTFKKINQLLETLINLRKLADLPAEISELTSCQNLKKFLLALKKININNWVLDFTIVRGFNYYTDLVFEVFDKHKDNNRSMFGGGRYNQLLESFGGQNLPAVGFGMGDVTMMDFLKSHKLMPKLTSPIDLYVVLLPDVDYLDIWSLLKNIRFEKLKVFVDSRPLKPNKKLETALKREIDYVLFIGQKDIDEGLYNLKHLPSKTEHRLSEARLISKLTALKGE
ncbi:MAG: histidine--tRNA ligase [Candidatus Saccharibacteria bacterium]|nr:histidine--tRNA ligase [Candidatus Saccharibacteria bacterium]